MQHARIILLVVFIVASIAGADAFFSTVSPSRATQAPKISLDMVTTGNSYDDSTNTMTVGTIDNCSTSVPGNNATHTFAVHLIIQDVEDLVGWQARLNYDGGKMRPASVNFTPFADNTVGQNISIVNLPIDPVTLVHRDIIGATSIPPAAAGAQTALIGSTYFGDQTQSVSSDTPAKDPPDDSSYSAASGGVLAQLTLQVLAGNLGQPNLKMDLDDDDPSPPGSTALVFTDTGTTTMKISETSLFDGFRGEGVPCLPVSLP